MRLKALSLTQPWANDIALGEKTIETRRWSTPWRGWFLICATRSRVPGCAGPYGCAVALAQLVHCRPMKRTDEAAACCLVYPGAWAWLLGRTRPLPPSMQFPLRGALGLFEVDVPPADEEAFQIFMLPDGAGRGPTPGRGGGGFLRPEKAVSPEEWARCATAHGTPAPLRAAAEPGLFPDDAKGAP